MEKLCVIRQIKEKLWEKIDHDFGKMFVLGYDLEQRLFPRAYVGAQL